MAPNAAQQDDAVVSDAHANASRAARSLKERFQAGVQHVIEEQAMSSRTKAPADKFAAVVSVMRRKDDLLVAAKKKEEASVTKIRTRAQDLQEQLIKSEQQRQELLVQLKKQNEESDEVAMMLQTAQLQLSAWFFSPMLSPLLPPFLHLPTSDMVVGTVQKKIHGHGE